MTGKIFDLHKVDYCKVLELDQQPLIQKISREGSSSIPVRKEIRRKVD